MEHNLVGIRLTNVPGRPVVVCSCGEMADGVEGAQWAMRFVFSNRVRLTPSLNWPGHFHTSSPVETNVLNTTFCHEHCGLLRQEYDECCHVSVRAI